MQVITSEISDNTVEKLNIKPTLIANLLHFYGGWEGFNKNNKQYTTAKVTKVTNTGIRIEVDGTDIDIMWKWKYAWLLSANNQSNNVKEPPIGVVRPNPVGEPGYTVSDEVVNLITMFVEDAKKISTPKWKTMSKQYYKNGRNGENFERYNSYNGSKSNFKYT